MTCPNPHNQFSDHYGDKYQTVDNVMPGQPVNNINLNTFLNEGELNQLRDRLQENLGFLNLNRSRIRDQEFTQLSNYHQYALNVLNNMIMIKQVEYTNPYQMHNSHKMAIYDRDGQLQIVDKSKFHRRAKEEWENQFDENLINPPCYMLPPTGCFNPHPKN